MSRGLRKVERAILEILENQLKHEIPGSNSIQGLASHLVEQGSINFLLGESITDVKGYASVQRACRSLERKGLLRRFSGPKQAAVELIRSAPSTAHNESG